MGRKWVSSAKMLRKFCAHRLIAWHQNISKSDIVYAERIVILNAAGCFRRGRVINIYDQISDSSQFIAIRNREVGWGMT